MAARLLLIRAEPCWLLECDVVLKLGTPMLLTRRSCVKTSFWCVSLRFSSVKATFSLLANERACSVILRASRALLASLSTVIVYAATLSR